MDNMVYIITWGRASALGVKKVATFVIGRKAYERALSSSEVSNCLCKRANPFITRVDIVKIDSKGHRSSESRAWSIENQRFGRPEYNRLISPAQKEAIRRHLGEEIE